MLASKLTGVLSLSFFIFGCSGGGGTGSTTGSASGSSSGSTASNGSTSNGSSSNGSSSGASSTGACTEFVPGGAVDPAIGGIPDSLRIVQAVADLAGVVAQQVAGVTVSCEKIAVALGAPAAGQAQANAAADPRAKADAWCKLAAAEIDVASAKAGGQIKVNIAPVICPTSTFDGVACGASCGSARCYEACDVRVVAAKQCASPAISATSNGASNAAEAAKLTGAIEAYLPAMLAMQEQCDLEADVVASFAATVSVVDDIKAVCIPKVIAAMSDASDGVEQCLRSVSSVVDRVR